MIKQRTASDISAVVPPSRISIVQPTGLSKMPLRAGYNSIVPDLEKWRKFDHDFSSKRTEQQSGSSQMWQVQLLKQWQLVLDKLHLSSAER